MPENTTNSTQVDAQLLLKTLRFDVERITYDDSQGHRHCRDVVRHPGSVAILPILQDGRVCLIRNQRMTVGETLLEVPAGTLEPDESPEDCARRELEEETGYTAGELHDLGWFYVSPGVLDEKMYLFFATSLEPGPPNRMPDENIENAQMSYEEATRSLVAGEIHDAKTVVALLRYPVWKDQQTS